MTITRQEIIDMLYDSDGDDVNIDLDLLSQCLQREQLTVDDSYTLLIKNLLPKKQYAAGQCMLSQSTALFKKVMQGIEKFDVDQCLRLLLTVDKDPLPDLRMIHALFNRLKKLQAFKNPSTERMIIAIVEHFITHARIININSLKVAINHLPDLNPTPLYDKQYFPNNYYPFSFRGAALLDTVIMLGQKELLSCCLKKTGIDISSAIRQSILVDNWQIYQQLTDYHRRATPDWTNDKLNKWLVFALKEQSMRIVENMLKNRYRLTGNDTDKYGNSGLMQWFLTRIFFQVEQRKNSVRVFQIFMRFMRSNPRYWEKINSRRQSFIDLFLHGPDNTPDVLDKAINKGIAEVTQDYPWLCLTQARIKLTNIAKKLQPILKKVLKNQKNLSKLAYYRHIEIFRIFMALYLRFPVIFKEIVKSKFKSQSWESFMAFYNNEAICWEMQYICRSRTDENDANYTHPFVSLPTCITHRIFSYLDTLLGIKRLVIPDLHIQLTDQWKALIQGRSTISSHWMIDLSVSLPPNKDQESEDQESEDQELEYQELEYQEAALF